MKRLLTGIAAMAAAVFTATPAAAFDGPAFSITFYADAAKTQVVGFARPVCNPEPAAQLWWGTWGPYEEVHWDVGWCIDGEYYPF